jgi:hypothetical protein
MKVKQFLARRGVGTDVPLLKNDFARLEIDLHQLTGEATGLGVDENSRGHALHYLKVRLSDKNFETTADYASRYSMWAVIFAVFSSMADTEQYFSFESRTASSTDLWDTLPPTR